MDRPEHPDFWLMSEVMLDLDDAATDVGIDRTVGTDDVDMESLLYSAMQRALRIIMQNGDAPDPKNMTQFSACWIDAFVIGMHFHKRKAKKLP